MQTNTKLQEPVFQQWVAQYKLGGKFTEPTRHFSGDFKLKVLNYQQEHHLSDSETALFFGITNQGTICAWRKKYITGGTEALFQKLTLNKTGTKKNVNLFSRSIMQIRGDTVTDVTQFNMFDTKLYLSPILDLHDQSLISWNLSDRPNYAQTVDMKRIKVKLKGLTPLQFRNQSLKSA